MLQNQFENAISVSRQQLYDEVWTTPAVTLAKRYRVSDVALGKICRKLNIPKPSSGYWAKVAHGKQDKRPSLPPLPAGAPTVVTIRGAPSKGTAQPYSETVQQQLLYEQTHPIHVPARLTQYHPFLRSLPAILKSASKDKYGALESRESHRLNVRVSSKSLSRALRLLSVLLTALEARGFAVSVKNEHGGGLQVQVIGQTLEFALEERFRQFPRDQKANQSPLDYQRYDYEATGELSLRIKTIWGEDVRKVWRDTTRARLEGQLNDVMVGLVVLAEAQRDQLLERDRRHREWEQERLRQEAEVRRRQEEERRREALERESAQWAQANQIRAYVEAIKTAGEQQGCSPTAENSLGRWLNWATEHANRLDPVRQLVPVLTEPLSGKADELENPLRL